MLLSPRLLEALSAVAVLAAVGCGESSSDSTEKESSAITVDGVYKADANGAYAWSSFHDGHYALWSGSAACAAADADETTCGETGSFTTDADGRTLTLTVDGTARVHQLHIDVLASAPLVAGTTTQSLRPQVGLVGTGAALVGSSSDSSSLVANQFSAEDSGNDGSLVHQVVLRTTTFALLSVCSIAMFNPADKKIEQPIAPAQITSSCVGGKK